MAGATPAMQSGVPASSAHGGPKATTGNDLDQSGGVDSGKLVSVYSKLLISEHARIEGAVFASELLELQPKGRIMGNVHYKLLEMHGGATVTGTLTHQPTDETVFHLAVAEASEA